MVERSLDKCLIDTHAKLVLLQTTLCEGAPPWDPNRSHQRKLHSCLILMEARRGSQ